VDQDVDAGKQVVDIGWIPEVAVAEVLSRVDRIQGLAASCRAQVDSPTQQSRTQKASQLSTGAGSALIALSGRPASIRYVSRRAHFTGLQPWPGEYIGAEGRFLEARRSGGPAFWHMSTS
jgi:hypothetical protein